MRSVQQHKSATKNLSKAPRSIQKKAIEWLEHFLCHGNFNTCRFEIAPLKGKLKFYQEVKLDKDYRIFFRTHEETLFIRAAGTHNQLKIG